MRRNFSTGKGCKGLVFFSFDNKFWYKKIYIQNMYGGIQAIFMFVIKIFPNPVSEASAKINDDICEQIKIELLLLPPRADIRTGWKMQKQKKINR